MSHQGSRSARARSLTLAAALFAALGVFSLFAQGAFAGTPLNGGPAPLTGSTFQGADGNQKTPLPGDPDYVALPARTDWQNYAASPKLQKLADGSGLQDTWFKQGKEQEPDGWTFQQTAVTPGKADVLGAWTVSDPVSANVYLYLSFFREAAGGTTFYNFELNQQATTWTNRMGTVIPCRRDGDVIVTFELQGGAGDVGVDAWRWQSDPSQPGPAACPQGKIGSWSHTGALSTDASGNTIAQGAMNTGEIDNYLDFNLDGDNNPATNPSPAKFSTPDTFGEAALNLSKVLAALNQGDSCFNFGQLQLHTRSSSPFTADLKDFIAPKPIVARSCSIDGTKYHDANANGQQDAGENGLAGFRIYADKNDNNAFDAGEPSTFTADGSSVSAPVGSWTLTNLPAGNYKIREDLANLTGNPRATEGWACSDPAHGDGTPASATEDCEFAVSLAGGGTVGGLKFGNYKPAVITVEKQTVPDGAAGSFAFTSTIPGKGSFNLSDGGVETTTVTPGTYTATESGHPDFDLTGIACTGDGDSSGAGQTATFNAQSGETITCTFTNTRKTGQLTVRKVLDPASDPGTFDLKIGNDLVVDDGGHLAQGTRALPTGAGYTVTEFDGTGTSLAKYDSAIECKDGDTVVESGTGTSLSGVPVIEGHEVVCTFTNTRRPGTIKVVKDLVPNGDAGTFDLKVGGTLVKPGASHGDSGSATVAPGAYTVSETGANGTSLVKYDSAIECKDGDTVVESGTGASLPDVAVDSNQTIVCTITNKRRTGSLTVIKDLVPATDEGRFDLRIASDVVKSEAGDGGQGAQDVAPGDYTVSEVAHTGTDLAKYDKSIACTRNGQQAEAGDGASLDGVTVDSDDVVVCTITNQRRNGSITVVKDLIPGTDGGRFDLKVGDDVVAPAAGDGGQGAKDVAPGDHTVSEVGANAELTDYDTSIACDNGKSGSGSTLAGVHVDSNDEVTCTITNTRRPGKLTVVKDLKPAGDGGHFDLRIGDDVVKAAAGDDESGSKTVAPGDYAVSELGASGTSLAKYDANVACDNGESGSGSSLAAVHVDSNDDVTCTITNERRKGSITVVKDLKPADDDGTFDLKVGDDVVKAAAGDGGQGSKPVGPGTYGVSEAGAGSTSLADYDSRIACLKNDEAYKSGPGTSIGGLAVDSDDAIVCTITNIRHGSVTVTKTEGGQEPSRTWTFRLTGGPDNVNITRNTTADGNPLSFGHLKPGAYTLCEIDLPAGWHSSLGAELDGKACVELEIEPGEAEAVAVDNTRPETLVIKEGNLLVHHGDTITYTFDVSNKGNTPLKDVSVEDDRCDADPVRDAGHDQGDDGDALLETGEVWRFTCTMVVPQEHNAEEENPIHNVATAHAFDQAGNEVTDTDSHDTTIIHPAIAVQKTGAEFAYAGDTVTYTFAVTNPGDTPLAGVTVSDDRCAPVTGPTAKEGGDADDSLEPGETWTFTCAKQVPADHKIGDENPIRNVATATGTDELDKTVTSIDDHQMRVLHPAVDVEKTGPASATVGTPLGYTLTVTNPGDVPFAAQEVGVTDPRCEAPPAGPGTGADATPGQLDPGDTWIYMCTAQTTGQPAGTFVNTATVTAKDFNGHPVSDTDEFPTTLHDQQQVLPEEIVSGTARLGGPSGCVKTAFNATVRGRKIASVTFYIDGAQLKRVVAKSAQRVFRAKVRPGRALGVHRVTARVVFKASSRTKARTLRLSFRRCARQVITPQFTG
jgi:hypothetical protein